MISKIFPSIPCHDSRPLLCHTSKFMEMGGRAHFFLSLVGRSSISALICDSFMPAMRLILGTQGHEQQSAGKLEKFQGGGERERTQEFMGGARTRKCGKDLDNHLLFLCLLFL